MRMPPILTLKMQRERKIFRYLILLLAVLFLTACQPAPTVQPTQTPIRPDDTMPTVTVTPAPSRTATLSPQPSATATETFTPTVILTPTYAFPAVVVNVNAAHCRYGPSKAFLHAADLYEGDQGVVHGRFPYSDWLYVKWDKLHYHCWVSPYVVDVSGDLAPIAFQDLRLQQVGSNMYGPPRGVSASRTGDQVTISWRPVPMTVDDDRGYLIIAWVCQDGAYIWWTVGLEDRSMNSYTVKDDNTCSSPSYGELYTVEKHGFSEPVPIPWPAYQP